MGFGGLGKSGPQAHVFEYLSPVGETVWQGSGGAARIVGGGVSLGMGFEVSEAQAMPS